MTVYDLIGRIKEGKAPEKIVLFGEEFNYDKDKKDYVDGEGDWLFEDYDWLYELDTKLENWVDYVISVSKENFGGFYFIPPKAHKHIEKIDDIEFEKTGIKFTVLKEKVNELIDEVNKINERV